MPINLSESLEYYFGYGEFREGQQPIIESILRGQDVLGVLPTGGGKSLCYQLPALLMPGITLVISPLISLMKDQVDSLTEHGIPAGYLNSNLDSKQFYATLQQLRSGELKLLYVAPERLENQAFIQELTSLQIAMIAIDEAHCVSQWGHDFRPSYRTIVHFIQQLNNRPVLTAFTATATSLVQEDIIDQLELKHPTIIINSFDRPNIKFTVSEPKNKRNTLKSYLSKDEAIIIYANSRKTVDTIQHRLTQADYQATKYHAGMSSLAREKAQNDFIYDRCNIIVATNAFGMGIDKTDVRKVIHYNMPTDLESYYQEAGRAGRDGLESEAILLFSNQDIMTSKRLIASSKDPSIQQRLNVMIRYAKHTKCLRNYILNYFNEETTEPCMNCSSCLNEYTTKDVTKEAQMILSCIVRMKHGFGMTMVTNVLRGSREQKILSNGFDSLSTYGLMKDYSTGEVKDIISSLIADNYLSVNEYQGLELTKEAPAVLSGLEKVFIKEKEYKTASAETLTVNKGVISRETEPQDDDLYERLRELRYEIATEEKVPAYIIFNNKSLIDMTFKLPTSYEEFLEIEGVGKVKADKYWQAFTTLITEFTAKTT